jgi:hypothetical protein
MKEWIMEVQRTAVNVYIIQRQRVVIRMPVLYKIGAVFKAV